MHRFPAASLLVLMLLPAFSFAEGQAAQTQADILKKRQDRAAKFFDNKMSTLKFNDNPMEARFSLFEAPPKRQVVALPVCADVQRMF